MKSLGMEEKVRWEEAGLRFLGFMTEHCREYWLSMTSEKILLWIAFSGNCQHRFADPLGNDDPTDETNT